jgi:hypothetical protein
MRVPNATGGPQASLPSVEASGVRLTKQAADHAARAAVDTARAFHPPDAPTLPKPAVTVSLSNESRDLAQATVELIGAKAEMKAGATLIRTGDELTKETLSMLDRRK